MKQIVKILSILVVLSAFFSCGTQHNNILSRTYNSMAAKYNILYNGKIAYQKGLDELTSKNNDNFSVQLLLEPIHFEKKVPTVSDFNGGFDNGFNTPKKSAEKNQTPFEKAEEKASKAIQLHSMLIDGKERNNQIDEAYLLLGKSRYYTQRFVPAIAAFNFIIEHYPKASLIDETRIWRAKANIKINNDGLAIESLQLLLRKQYIADKIREEAHTTLAIAYLKAKNNKLAIDQLVLATKTHVNTNQTARNLFVLGQLYAQENNKKQATNAFKKVLKLKGTPYTFVIHAKIEIAKLLLNATKNGQVIARFLQLANEVQNADYLNELYYQIGLLEQQRDSTKKAIFYLQKAVQAPNTTNYKKTFPYEKLGDIAFQKTNFISAGAYYDSVIQISGNSTERRIRAIRRKHKNLTALINLENLLKKNDSILSIVRLPKEQQRVFFEKYIEKLKQKEKAAAQQKLKNLSFGTDFGNTNSLQTSKKGKWYFYNTQSLQFGKASFEKVWGNRPLEDNWRFSSQQSTSTITDTVTKKSTKNVAYNINTYLNALPKNQTAIDSLIYYRNDALYQTGIIYKEQFKDLPLASKRLERLLTLHPKKQLVLPAKYHLYQVYKELKDARANQYKTEIITAYPTSVYAKILKGFTPEITNENSSQTEAIYKELYYLYKEKKYYDVASQIIELEPTIQKSKLIAKFELLKALAIGKYKNKASFKAALLFVVKNYPNTEEGKRAKQLVKQLK